MVWSTSTRLGLTAMRSRQHCRMVLTLPLPLWPQRESRESGSTLRHRPHGGNDDVTIGEAHALWTERLAVLVHRWAEAGGEECELIQLRTAALPSSAPHRGTDFLCLLMCRPRRRLLEVEGGREGGSGVGVRGRQRGGAGGVRGMSDRCGVLDVALRA